MINQCKNLEQIIFTKDVETGLLKDDPPRPGWRDHLEDARSNQRDFTQEKAKQLKLNDNKNKISKIVIKRKFPLSECDMTFFKYFLLPNFFSTI